jgi:hypothetical protein
MDALVADARITRVAPPANTGVARYLVSRVASKVRRGWCEQGFRGPAFRELRRIQGRLKLDLDSDHVGIGRRRVSGRGPGSPGPLFLDKLVVSLNRA